MHDMFAHNDHYLLIWMSEQGLKGCTLHTFCTLHTAQTLHTTRCKSQERKVEEKVGGVAHCGISHLLQILGLACNGRRCS